MEPMPPFPVNPTTPISTSLAGNNSRPFVAPAQKPAAGPKQPGRVKRPAGDQQLDPLPGLDLRPEAPRGDGQRAVELAVFKE
mgnify:CR=1 FL=1